VTRRIETSRSSAPRQRAGTAGKARAGTAGKAPPGTAAKPRQEGRTAGRTAPAYPTRGATALVTEPAARQQLPVGPPVPRLKVAPPPPVPVPRTPFVALVLLVVAAGVLGILLLNTKVNENAFILHDLRQEQAALDQRQQELEQEIAQAGTPARLAEEARRLGLVQAEELAYLRLPDGELVHEPMPAHGPTHPDGQPEGTDDTTEPPSASQQDSQASQDSHGSEG
jgi:cell division protein FtsB